MNVPLSVRVELLYLVKMVPKLVSAEQGFVRKVRSAMFTSLPTFEHISPMYFIGMGRVVHVVVELVVAKLAANRCRQ